jgi:hypothetical protein
VRAVSLIVAAIVLTAGVAHAAAGRGATGRTYIYVGEKRVGYVDPDEQGHWGEGSCEETISFDSPRRLIESINEGSAYEGYFDYLQRVTATRWYHYARRRGGWIQHGKVRRVNATRWNVLILGRRIGYVRGPNGPPAALALLSHYPGGLECLR